MFSDNKVNSMSYLFRRRWWSPADVSERLQWPLVKVHSSFITLLRRRRRRRRLSVFSFTIHTWLSNYRRRVWGKIEKKDKSWNKKTVFAWILCSRTFRADVRFHQTSFSAQGCRTFHSEHDFRCGFKAEGVLNHNCKSLCNLPITLSDSS